MPQVKADLVDGFYRNEAKDKDGNPRALTLGPTVNMKPGATRWVPAHLRQESRSVNTAFEAALANGNLVGPMAERGGSAPEPAKAAPPPPPAEEETPPPAEEAAPPAAEEPPPMELSDADVVSDDTAASGEGDPEPESSSTTKKKRRRRRKSSDGE